MLAERASTQSVTVLRTSFSSTGKAVKGITVLYLCDLSVAFYIFFSFFLIDVEPLEKVNFKARLETTHKPNMQYFSTLPFFLG